MPGFKDFIDLTALPESDLDDYLAKQVLMKFATEAARDAAVTGAVKREGMATIQDDTNCITVSRNATGGQYSTIGPVHGALSVWTPTVAQSGAVAVTVTAAGSTRTGRWIQGYFQLAVTGTGTANQAVVISGIPATGVGISGMPIGTALIYDATGPTSAYGVLCMGSTTTFDIRAANGAAADPRFGITGNPFAAALGSGDLIWGTFAMLAAADA